MDNFDLTKYMGTWFEYSNVFEIFQVKINIVFCFEIFQVKINIVFCFCNI